MSEKLERFAEISPHEFETEFAAKCRPAILTGHQPLKAVANVWTLDYLVARHPDQRVEVDYYHDGDPNRAWVYLDMMLGEYISKLRDPQNRRKYYVAERPIDKVIPNLAPEIPPPRFVENHKGIRPVVFMGIDTYTKAHYHHIPDDALLMQVHGRKRVVMCRPESFRDFYPYSWQSLWANFSSIDCNPEPGGNEGRPFAPWLREDDRLRFPRATRAPVMEHTLEPGEALYIPQGWIHLVYGIGENISVSYFFHNSWRHAYAPIAMRDAAWQLGYACLKPVDRACRALRRQHTLTAVLKRLGVVDEQQARIFERSGF